jgi:methionyl-tRNA formyltransferase
MLIQLLIDNSNSWIVPYADTLKNELQIRGHFVDVIYKHNDVKQGDILILLSCERKFTRLELNKYNLVVHESNLPKGKGWSPITWQILEGKDEITFTLFEAAEEIDAGPIYLQKKINLTGHELLEEIKHIQGLTTIELILDFTENIYKISSVDQVGESTFYNRRREKDSELDVNKTILEQFNLLRVCDNDRYPAWFELHGVKYKIKIYKA